MDLVGIRIRRTLAATLIGLMVSGVAAKVTPFRSSIVPASDEAVATPWHEVPPDLYGNEVRQAIAKYKVDPTGALYEEHSPETEVPKLAPPKG